MRETASVVIIGGGIIGSSVAYHLAEMGRTDVVLLEQASLASGASSRSDNIIEKQLPDPFDVLLRMEGVETFRHLFEDLGVIFRRIGYARLTGNEDDLSRFEESARVQRSLGYPDSRVIGPDEIKKVFPFLNLEGIIGALYGPSDGMSDGVQLTLAYASEARRRGVQVCQDTKATKIHRTGSGFVVSTTRGQVKCRDVVNAAGPRADRVSGMLGLEVPMRPVRNQTVVLDVPYENAGMLPVCDDEVSRFYIHGAGYGRTVFSGATRRSGTDERPTSDPDTYDQRLSPDHVELVKGRLTYRAPGLAGAFVKGGWACTMNTTPDRRPIVGRHPDVPEFFNCVLGDQGIQLSAPVGRISAEILVDGRPKRLTDMSKLSIERFSR